MKINGNGITQLLALVGCCAIAGVVIVVGFLVADLLGFINIAW